MKLPGTTFLKAFGYFWWDLVIGDDWRIAGYVVAILTLVGVLARSGVSDPVLVVGGGLALMSCFAAFLGRDARR